MNEVTPVGSAPASVQKSPRGKKEANLHFYRLLLVSNVLMWFFCNSLHAQTAEPVTRTSVVLLGTGTPNADPQRSGPAVAVVVDSTAYLIDAGPGVVRRAVAASERHGIAALEPSRLGHVFLTHLHSDHTVGLPDLLFTPWVLERQSPLTVIGPPGSERMMTHLAAAFQEDVYMRLFGLEPANPTGHEARVTETSGGLVFQDERVRVTAFRVPHGSWPVALAYRFDTPDRSIVISGDTGPAEDVMVRACDGCDLLIHEVYAKAGWDRREPVWQRYHAASHTSGPELGHIATRSGARELVLIHQLLWGATPEQLLAEIAASYAGPIHYGNDLDVH